MLLRQRGLAVVDDMLDTLEDRQISALDAEDLFQFMQPRLFLYKATHVPNLDELDRRVALRELTVYKWRGRRGKNC